MGSIGRAIEIGMEIFRAPFVPVLAAAPALGRYTVFGTHFARYGIGSAGAIHRLDRHPSVSQHPVTPMTEADLRLHLATQTRKGIALLSILDLRMPEPKARAIFRQLLRAEKPEVVLFDALSADDLKRIGRLLHDYGSAQRPLFSVGSSGIEAALASTLTPRGQARGKFEVPSAAQLLVASGSCSPVTSSQIAWALKHGFAEVPLDVASMVSARSAEQEIGQAANETVGLLRSGRDVIVHTTRTGANKGFAAQMGNTTAAVLGNALGRVLGAALQQSGVRRLCIAGGDTSSYAARALGIEMLEMIAPLSPGAPLCRATAPNSPADGLEVVFKGGQLGGTNYFKLVQKGKP
jgi:uncharacterized protein YgbK (DUF1537 family)